MTNYEQLAQRIVALLGGYTENWNEPRYSVPACLEYLRADEFVKDPRVAMAMMELLGSNTYNCVKQEGHWHVNQQGYGKLKLCTAESLPLAINLACVEALAAVEGNDD